MANEIQKTSNANKMTFSAFMTSDLVKNRVNKIIGSEKGGAKFVANIVSAVQNNPTLQECSNQSILSCALVANALDLSLSPQLGLIYMIPFNNKQTGIKEAQIQLSYKSYIQLAIRSGYYKKINVLPIKKGELIKYDPLEEEIEVKLIEDEVERENAETIGIYGMFEYSNGFRKCMYWSIEKILNHADKYSQSFNKKTYEDIKNGKIAQKDMWKYSSPWYSKTDDMASKTVLKQLLSKYGILSVEMQEAFEKDQSVIKEDGTPVYVDNNNEDYIIVNEEQENQKEIKSLDEID